MRSAFDLADTPVWSQPRAATPARTSRVATTCQVAVIGAGPYGLAVSAHLQAAGIDTRTFGEVMGFWRHNMPLGMKLRSPWRASHIADPAQALTLDTFAGMRRLGRTENVPLEEFVTYGEWFQIHAVPDLDPRRVARVMPIAGGFRLQLTDGDSLTAHRVVIATGLAHQDFRPAVFAGAPAALASHSSAHADFEAFRGRRVAVIGRGQSACESAVLLSEGGAEVELISRGDIRWIGVENPGAPDLPLRSRVREALAATGAVGPFPLDWLVDMPSVVSLLSPDLREELAVRSLRPAATAWLRPRARGVKFNPGRSVLRAQPSAVGISLELDDGTVSEFDHVLLATGYKADLARLGILAPALLDRIECIDGYPRLWRGLESTVPGLHFAGAAAVKSFGPLMRFVHGAGYAARAITRSASARVS